MGIIRPFESESIEIEEFRRMLLSCAAVQRRKDDEDFQEHRRKTDAEDDGEKLVCVTAGVSFLGLAIVKRLLLRGYSVRVVVTKQEDMEKLREIEANYAGDAISNKPTTNVSAVMADVNEVESLSDAFDGCRGVFHTAAFVDPAGLSGYSKSMADIEVKTCENVMEACARTPSVRSCVLTSSLLACIWRDNNGSDLSSTVNHDCWSDQSVCLDKKLWYALGKLRAEKSAWRIAEEKGLKLVVICPGLITGPEYCHRNPTATFAYLKGAQEMYAYGLLSTVNVDKLAAAHVSIFKTINKTAFGRYICFDNIIQNECEVEKLAGELGLQTTMFTGINVSTKSLFRFELSNAKLSRLMMRRERCSDES